MSDWRWIGGIFEVGLTDIVGVWPCWKKACYTFNLKQRDQFILQRDLMLSIKSSPAVTLIPNILLYLINNSKY